MKLPENASSHQLLGCIMATNTAHCHHARSFSDSYLHMATNAKDGRHRRPTELAFCNLVDSNESQHPVELRIK